MEIAFQEAKADVTRYSIDLVNKPEWYASRVNPASKVPALVYGSPKSDPENPSPESARITESLVLLKFVADLYPDSGLLPKDPVERVPRAVLHRCGIDQGLPGHRWFIANGRRDPGTTPACCPVRCRGHLTIANSSDRAVPRSLRAAAPQRCTNDVGKYAEGSGPGVHKELFQSERFAQLQKYFANISKP
ncbi:hypothetical protein EDB83DRAFT_2555106 [Lactarius deliciosus]|nr:hypothetical protein EDB83DRAFT_2555106 [Lactarius deliciosus]